MSFLLMIFFTLICLFPVYPEPLFCFPSPVLALALTLLGTLALLSHSLWVTRTVCQGLASNGNARDRLIDRYEKARVRHRLALLSTYVLILFVGGWGWLVRTCWVHAEGQSLPGTELLLLLPFLGIQILSWVIFFDAERALARSSPPVVDRDPSGWLEPHHLGENAATNSAPPPQTRSGYVLFHLRQKLVLVFLPVTLLIIQNELHRLYPRQWELWKGATELLGLFSLVIIFLFMPWVVRLLLGLKPLPDGPLRDRLLAASKRLNFRCSNVLFWNTRKGMANAMVIGLLPWVRYVVFTDRLLEEFSEDEIEAVFGHEVGHVKHHHMLYYLGFLTASVAVLGLAGSTFAVQAIATLRSALSPETLAYLEQTFTFESRQYLQVIPLVVVMLGYIFVVFGFLSRRCERQADIFGCRAVSCAHPDCWTHGPREELVPGGRGLCLTGIRTFIGALEKVALVNGISRDRPGFLQSWQHSTIARRVEFLQDMLLDPTLEARFQRRVHLVKWGLFAALGGILLLVFTTQGWQL
jgi:STE24 endopeptidase